MSRKAFMRRLTILAAAVCLLNIVAAVMRIQQSDPTGNAGEDPYILIDPGHGGADGGAVAADGTLEKDINLAISRPLADLLRIFGYTVKMSRETDVSIHDADVSGLKNQKVSDIHNRAALAQGSLITVSIHQNKFEQTQYSGTQVFYSPNDPAGEGLAAAVRQSVLTLLQPDNTRPLKKGDKNVYLLTHSTRPTALVECGFLSNVEEREKLKTAEYQQQMAFAIGGGILQYAP